MVYLLGFGFGKKDVLDGGLLVETMGWGGLTPFSENSEYSEFSDNLHNFQNILTIS